MDCAHLAIASRSGMSASTQPYGPQSAAIRAFLVHFAGLGADDRARVVAAHHALADSREWHSAERQLADVVERSGRENFRDALSGPLLQLVRVPGRALPTDEAEGLDALDPVAEPALAALLALLVSDLLAASAARTLLAPFDGVLSLPTNDRTL